MITESENGEASEEEAARWMRRCLEVAEEARTGGDAPVGAVIVRNDELIAEAFEAVVSRQDGTAHAEMIAIRRACRALGTMDLSGSTLYTNVEPCWMCSFAIRETGIGQVVIGVPVEDIGGVTSRYPILSDSGVADWGPPPKITWQTQG